MPVWIHVIEWASRLILVLLFLLSIWSMAIMLDRRNVFYSLRLDEASEKIILDYIQQKKWTELTNFLREEKNKNPDKIYIGALLTAIEQSHFPAFVEKAVRSFLLAERMRLEKGFTVLATLGSNAPFIGLFGTVLGIIQAFGAIGANVTSSGGAVMSSISEALIATAVGLFVAIPAVIAYNVFTHKLKILIAESERLKDRYYLARHGSGA